jgi:hypothetical protein
MVSIKRTQQLAGALEHGFYFPQYLRDDDPICFFFFRWVETTNQENHGGHVAEFAECSC